MSEDPYRAFAEAYVLGALDPSEQASRVEELQAILGVFLRDPSPVPPDPRIREQVLDLAQAPSLPLDLLAIPWQELAPGVRYHVHREDPTRGVRGCLVWAEPGARHGRHRHQGDETILVLKGGLRDERGAYGPGEICRSAAGSEHSEQALPGEDCLCYVVYYGELEMLE